jgi:methylmalonyl-CoA/ethylmalonyl-CoA epimerase
MALRLDHVAIAVLDTERALLFFRDRLGLAVVAVDEPPPPSPAVRLTYLDAGDVSVQLVEPLDPDSPLAAWLVEHGEGLHHVCFGTDDVPGEVRRLSGDVPFVIGSGRGLPAAFLPGELPHGVRIEFTEGAAADGAGRNSGAGGMIG